MKLFFKPKYRIVVDDALGYEVQIKRWFFPFWLQVSCNTHSSIEAAEDFARRHAREVVKEIGKL